MAGEHSIKLLDRVHRSPLNNKETEPLIDWQILKSPPSHKAMEGEGGAGENRTPVQTSNYNAFYMLSSCLIFDV